MKRITGIIAVLALILISGVSVSAAESLKDSFATGDDNDSTTWAIAQIVGQTWTASSSYQLSSIELYMRRVGNPGNVILNIRTTTDGNPLSANLASIELVASSIPATNSWVRFDIPTSTIIDIEAGSIYWWGVYAASGNPEGNYYAIRFDKDNGYNGGHVTNWSSLKRIWAKSLGFDNLFRIYGEELITTMTVTETVTVVITETITETLTQTTTETVTATGDPQESESQTSCVIPAIVTGIVSGLIAAAIVGVFAYGRGVTKGINRQTSLTQPIATAEKADTDEEEEEKSIILTMSCRVKNQISGEETYIERELN